MAGKKRDAWLMLESHDLMKAYNYKVLVSVGAKGVWTFSMAIIDTGIGPNLIQEKVMEVISLNGQRRQLQEKIGFSAMSNLETIIFWGTAFISDSFAHISCRSMWITPFASGPVAIIGATQEGQILTIEKADQRSSGQDVETESPCIVT